jgi:hypothetical protein
MENFCIFANKKFTDMKKTNYSESPVSVKPPRKRISKSGRKVLCTNLFVPKGYLSLQQFEKELVSAVVERL